MSNDEPRATPHRTSGRQPPAVRAIAFVVENPGGQLLRRRSSHAERRVGVAELSDPQQREVAALAPFCGRFDQTGSSSARFALAGRGRRVLPSPISWDRQDRLPAAWALFAHAVAGSGVGKRPARRLKAVCPSLSPRHVHEELPSKVAARPQRRVRRSEGDLPMLTLDRRARLRGRVDGVLKHCHGRIPRDRRRRVGI